MYSNWKMRVFVVAYRSLFIAGFVTFAALCGCGKPSVSANLGELSVNSVSVSFGSLTIGDKALTKSLTLSNIGTAPVAIASISISGSNSASFSIVNACSSTLAVGANCTVQVGFSPKAVGAANASLDIQSNSSIGTQTVMLAGTGATNMPPTVVIYGATPSGIAAALEAAQLGKSVVLLEPSEYVGGMISSGLGHTDTYSSAAIGGLARQFFQNVNAHYAGNVSSHGGLYFEPHVAEAVFNSMLAQNSNITVVLGASLLSVHMTGTTITGIVAGNGVTYEGQEFIDSSYTGDLMAAAHVNYTVGREPSLQYKESKGGIGTPGRMGTVPIDPYITPGDPTSGLIAHVEQDTLGTPGSADTSEMAYNYRFCISFDPANRIQFPIPEGYDPTEFEILGRLAASASQPMQLSDFLATNQLPNNKLDMNQSGYFSTNDVGANKGYSESTTADREKIEAEHRRYIQALVHFIQTDSRIPKNVAQNVRNIGLCKDEFADNGGWPRQLYVRAARRMVGAYVLSENDIYQQTTITDSIGLGGYSIDDQYHHIVNINGEIFVEHQTGPHPSPYPIPYRILTPLASQASNLLVTVGASASHFAYCSLRIETTYMILGQAAGAAASLAIDIQEPVQNVNYSLLGSQLVRDGAILTLP